MNIPSLQTPLPSIAPFADIAALLQPPGPQFNPATPREETQLELLAFEIVRYAPKLAEMIEEAGMRRLREEFAQG